MYKTITLAMVLSFCAANAFANAPTFEMVDADKDGAVSVEEAMAAGMSEEVFTKLDVDKSGTLSIEEFSAVK
jgi:Ca2+-binding EF-hand superfamily protein